MSKITRFVWIIAAACLVWAVILALDVVPQLRGDYGWRWPFAEPENYTYLLPLIISLIIYMGLGWKLQGRATAHLLIAWAVLGGIVLTVAALYVTTDRLRYELYTRTISGLSAGWHYAAADMDDRGGAEKALEDWPDFMASYEYFSSHMTTSPPGMPLTYYGVNQLLEKTPVLTDRLAPTLRAEQCHNYRIISYSDAELSSAWLGMLTPLWGSLIALPLYWLGRRLYSEQAARWSVLWWPLIPAFLMFTPTPNTLYPCLTVLVLVFLAKGILDRQARWVLAAGLGAAILTFIHFTLLPIIFFAGLFTLGEYFRRRKSDSLRWHWPIIIGAWFGAGLLLFWGGFYLVSGVTIWDIMDQAFNEHLTLDRPYFPWLFLHLNDFFMFTGWPLTLLAGVGIGQIVRAFRRKEAQSLSPGAIFSVGAVVTLLVIDLSGTQRGESGRIWLFLSPVLVLMAGSVIGGIDARNGKLITVVQAGMVVVMVGYLRVIGSGLSEPPQHAPVLTETSPTALIGNGSEFAGTLDLLSFAGHIEMLPDDNGTAQPTLVIWLNWRSKGQLDIPYYLSFIPVSPEGQPQPATVLQPFDEQYPITCWLPTSGEMNDRLVIPLHSESADGEWWVSLAIMDRNGKALEVTTPNGTPDQQVGLGPFKTLTP
ncbi:MAG: glycosyltransferase family 39 protein [Chloroflexi bacterium]|nr:glycosyltransferase family 39 protein [Chloroflexota bacterium]